MIMDKEKLFICTVDELKKKSHSIDEYDIIHISLLTRRLIWDNFSLVDQVNRDRRIKVIYKVKQGELPDEYTTIWSVADGLDPATSRPGLKPLVELNKDAFLATKVMKANKQFLTIKNILTYTGFVAGGIHPGSPKSEKDEILTKLSENLFIGGLPAGLSVVRAIGRVVVTALEPIYLSITHS